MPINKKNSIILYRILLDIISVKLVYALDHYLYVTKQKQNDNLIRKKNNKGVSKPIANSL